MVDPHCSPEVEAIIAFGTSTGVPMKVTSTIRPGTVTILGNRSPEFSACWIGLG